MRLSDTHCHVGVEATLPQVQDIVAAINVHSSVTQRFFHLMSTNHWDMDIVIKLAASSNSVVPYMGIHPWYSHLYRLDPTLNKKKHYEDCLEPGPSDELLSVLPEPIDLEEHLEKIRKLAESYDEKGVPYGIGEIGLDKVFRVPSNGYFGNQNDPKDVVLNKSKVSVHHQKQVFIRQLELANLLSKQVSVHCVKAHGPLFEIVSKDFSSISNVILHSYTGSLDQAKSWVREFAKQKRQLRFSFSNYINASAPKEDSLRELLKVLDDTQILLESDMPVDRFLLEVGEQVEDYFDQLRNVGRVICETKGWEIEEGMHRLYHNALQLIGK